VDWTEDSINRLYVEIGIRVRNARKKRGWTQAELATAVNLTRSSIANIEAGRQPTLIHVIVLIAHNLDTPAETLLPTGQNLDDLASVQTPTLDLTGQSDTTHDFVTAALRRATGG
jgi:transcriptional regulator with XRE-family HTH domain